MPSFVVAPSKGNRGKNVSHQKNHYPRCFIALDKEGEQMKKKEEIFSLVFCRKKRFQSEKISFNPDHWLAFHSSNVWVSWFNFSTNTGSPHFTSLRYESFLFEIATKFRYLKSEYVTYYWSLISVNFHKRCAIFAGNNHWLLWEGVVDRYTVDIMERIRPI